MEKQTIYEKPVRAKTMLAFTLPSVVLMVFTSMYTVVDGIVVSNFVGSLGLSAINIVFPLQNLNVAASVMLATGSNAVIGRMLGEGRGREANAFMSVTTVVTLVLATVLAAVFLILDEPLYYMLGSDDLLLPYCVDYGKIVIPGSILMSMEFLCHSYLVTADRPHLALALTIGGGVVNVVLDVVLVGVLDLGVAGAAAASVAGQFLTGLVPFLLFFRKSMLIHFTRPSASLREFLFAMGNGASEMVDTLAAALTTTLYNLQLMHLVGEKGVAAFSAVLYLDFIFVAVSAGYTQGIAPVVSFHFGAGNRQNLQKLLRLSLCVCGVFSAATFLLAEFFNRPLVMIFASEDPQLASLMISGFRLLALKFLCSGLVIFTSGFFTALNNGRVSAFLSVIRTFVLEVGCLLLLPAVMGISGVWLALPISESVTVVISVLLLVKYRRRYGYFGDPLPDPPEDSAVDPS